MPKEQKSDTTKDSSPAAKGTPATATAQAIMDKENEQGFRGIEVDSTPNENYTVAGVTSGAPTPETDVELAKKTREETGLGLSALEASQREKDVAKGAK